MEEKLTEKVLGYLDKIEDLAESQLPDFATQYIQFLLVDAYINLFMVLIGFVGVFVCYKTFKFGMKLEKSKDCGDDGILFVVTGATLGIALLIICSLGLLREVGEIIKIKTAPKVYLLEHFR